MYTLETAREKYLLGIKDKREREKYTLEVMRDETPSYCPQCGWYYRYDWQKICPSCHNTEVVRVNDGIPKLGFFGML